ncbi:MAG: hypothetical protein PHP35_02400, partial [Candidatus Colwellbacteria bacterium]|nr:hypothetical protein [Candidatus Colwellbacteria bacterium]
RYQVSKLKTTCSAFVIYLGLNKKLNSIPKHFSTWLFSSYDIENCYSRYNLRNLYKLNYLLCSFPSLIDPSLAPKGKSIVRILMGAEYADKEKWENNKEKLFEKVIVKLQPIIPGIEECLDVKEFATPCSFYRYTLNRSGSIFGWQAIPSQIERMVFPYRTSIENLYLSGHWVTNGIGQCGVAGVAFSGKYTAQNIIRKSLT